MKKLIFLIAAVSALVTTACEESEKVGKIKVGFGETQVVKLQATRAELKTTGLTIKTEGTTFKNAGLDYRVAGSEAWTSAIGTLDADGKGFTTLLAGLTENTTYEYCAWAAGKDSGTESDTHIGTFTTRRYYEIAYQTNESIKGITASIYFSDIAFYENGIETPMTVYVFGYRKSGEAEWTSYDVQPEAGKFAIDLPGVGTMLDEEATYEYSLSCSYYSKQITDAFGHSFQTVKASLTVGILATEVIGKADGVICAAEVLVRLDDKQQGTFDGCSVDYREKGSTTWKNAAGTKLGEQMLQALIPASQLTPGKSYEYRFNVVRNQTTWTGTELYEFTYSTQAVAKIVGQWKLDSFNGQADLPYTVYLDITGDNNFSLYQHLTQAVYQKFTGMVSVMNDTVSGIYNDGVLWGTSYKLEMVDAQTMKWTDTSNSADVSVYKRSTIPDGIKSAPQASPARSAALFGERFL